MLRHVSNQERQFDDWRGWLIPAPFFIRLYDQFLQGTLEVEESERAAAAE